jgi:hypothetical protein
MKFFLLGKVSAGGNFFLW